MGSGTGPKQIAAAGTKWAGFLVLILMAAPFVWHAVARGLSYFDPLETALSRLFHAGDVLSNVAIYGHMVTGGVLTALAPVQMLGALRRRWPRLHHRIGYACAALAVATGAGGLVYIATQGTIGGALMSAGFAVYGVLLIFATFRTVQLARLRHPAHRAWAGRFIILSLASWFFRVQYGLWDGIFGAWGRSPDFSGGFDQAMTFGFYLPWLILYEAILRFRSSDRPRRG